MCAGSLTCTGDPYEMRVNNVGTIVHELERTALLAKSVYSENARSDAMCIPPARGVEREEDHCIIAIRGSTEVKAGNLYMHT